MFMIRQKIYSQKNCEKEIYSRQEENSNLVLKNPHNCSKYKNILLLIFFSEPNSLSFEEQMKKLHQLHDLRS